MNAPSGEDRVAVIFDMDGVIVDSAEAHLRSWRQLADEEGLSITAEQFAATFGRPSREIIRLLFGADRDEAEVRRLDERKEAIYRDLVRGQVPVVPGAVELIRGLYGRGVRLAIGSSGPAANVELVMGELGLGRYFHAVVTAEDVQRGKPDPQVFLVAADRLGVAPHACAVIEDAPAGIEAAHRGGMVAVALASMHPPERLAAAELVVDSLTQLRPDQVIGLARAGRADRRM